MRYLLDTNVCVMYLDGRSALIRNRILATPTDKIAVCAVVKAELFYGAKQSQTPTQTLERQHQFLNRFVSIPFEDKAAIAFGEIRAKLASAGTIIGAYDLQIAAIALANHLTLVTHNTWEFERVERLKLEDWELEVNE